MNKIENQICEAIDIIVQRSISQANYDRTIQGTVVNCVDETIGKYKIQYQDSTFYAYSTNLDTTYSTGTLVYILVPNNDLSSEKTILGASNKLGINYLPTVEEIDYYDIVGRDCVEKGSYSFGLASYNANRQVKVLYSKEYSDTENLIKINKEDLNEYLHQSDNLICGAYFSNNLPNEQCYKGNFGITFGLDFLDSNGLSVTRYYTINVDSMRGNPYKLSKPTRQYGIFPIEGEKFVEVNNISIFCYDFPNSKEDYLDDIFVTDIELQGAVRIPDNLLNGCYLSFLTKQGIYFDNTNSQDDSLSIEAQVRVKGKIADSTAQNIPFYWFIEHVGITSKSMYYNQYGGQGWKCINDYNVIQGTEENEEDVVEWIPSPSILNVKKSDVIAKETKYKCIAIYNGTAVEKTIVIKNLDSEYDITIESDSGTQFYFDIGNPILTCYINGQEEKDSEYIYSWAVTNNVNSFQTISNEDGINDRYEQIKSDLAAVLKEIEEGTKLYEAWKNQIEAWQAEIERIEADIIADKNVLYNLKINTITNFSTYSCTVYKGGVYLGTASIKIFNSLDAEGGSYTLLINNGVEVFKYNENGVSPANGSLENPMVIKQLSFTLYDLLGNLVEEHALQYAKIEWRVPLENTMLSIPDQYEDYEIDEENQIAIYRNTLALSYNIADRYSVNNTNNTITLSIDYNGIRLVAETSFTFLKEGEPGTNGTDYVCKIIPNVASGNIPYNPIVTQNGDTYSYSFNYVPAQSLTYFKAQLWRNGEIIYEGNVSSNVEGQELEIEWEIQANTYSSTAYDLTLFDIDSSTGRILSYNKMPDTADKYDRLSNIIKATLTFNNVTYYATLPIIGIRLLDSSYTITLKDRTGFKYATYANDGTNPKYDNSVPFELEVRKGNLNVTSSIAYIWRASGSRTSYIEGSSNSTTVTSTKFLTLVDDEELESYKKFVKPADNYDGSTVNNGLCCDLYDADDKIGTIHIPIHLLLNRYGYSNLNGWDGNSIEISEEGGYILSPQVGAGIKESDNSFTGVLIGKAQVPGESENVGLLAFGHGQRSVFIDANTGKATFGIDKHGQIVIDPSSREALIYGGNYISNAVTGTGMLINLSDPSIKYGNGYFSVDNRGFLTAKGGGSIAGWGINDYQLYAPSSGTRSITLQSGLKNENGTFTYTPSIYSGSKSTDTSAANGFYLSPDFFAFGNKFKVYATGRMELGLGAVNPTVDENGIYTTSTARRWIIDSDSTGTDVKDTSIKYGTKGSNDSVYISTSEIQLANGFNVNSYGILKVGNISNTQGRYFTIAGYSDSFISYGFEVTTTASGSLDKHPSFRDILSSTDAPKSNSIYIGTDGVTFGNKFSYNTVTGVLTTKELVAENATLRNVKIESGDAEAVLGGVYKKIETTNSMLSQTFSTSQGKYDTTGYTINLYGSTNPNTLEKDSYFYVSASENNGKTYLDQMTGIVYKSNGTSWVVVTTLPLKIVTVESTFTQTASRLSNKISESTSKYDETGWAKWIKLRGIGRPDRPEGHMTNGVLDENPLYYLDPNDPANKGKFYLDQLTGRVYCLKLNTEGSYFWAPAIVPDDLSGYNGTEADSRGEPIKNPLPLITSQISSKIEQLAGSIKLSVTQTTEDGATKEASIKLTVDGIEQSAEKITFTGLVTFNSLSTAGKTTINGNNITTGTITLGGTNNPALILKNASGTECGRFDRSGASIGGFTITQNGIYGKNSSNRYIAFFKGAGNDNTALAIGYIDSSDADKVVSTDFLNAPFRVRMDGTTRINATATINTANITSATIETANIKAFSSESTFQVRTNVFLTEVQPIFSEEMYFLMSRGNFVPGGWNDQNLYVMKSRLMNTVGTGSQTIKYVG